MEGQSDKVCCYSQFASAVIMRLVKLQKPASQVQRAICNPGHLQQRRLPWQVTSVADNTNCCCALLRMLRAIIVTVVACQTCLATSAPTAAAADLAVVP